MGVVCLLNVSTGFPLVSLICKTGAFNCRSMWHTLAFLLWYSNSRLRQNNRYPYTSYHMIYAVERIRGINIINKITIWLIVLLFAFGLLCSNKVLKPLQRKGLRNLGYFSFDYQLGKSFASYCTQHDTDATMANCKCNVLPTRCLS